MCARFAHFYLKMLLQKYCIIYAVIYIKKRDQEVKTYANRSRCESRFRFNYGLYCYLLAKRRKSSRIDLSPYSILPRASKYLGLTVVLCINCARYRYLHVPRDVARYKALANSQYFKLLDNNQPNRMKRVGHEIFRCPAILFNPPPLSGKWR